VVETFACMFTFEFHAVYTREDGPPKPSPAGALSLCRAMGVAPAETLTVGDYKYDVIAGRDAGCRTVLVSRETLAAHELAGWGSPDLVVKSLRELLPLFGG
jgi:phosphoglycolate phosphatase-like HAD superfamily hydrolase